MSALKWIVSEAKKLKKQYPKRFKTWREYVAQASAIYSSKHRGKSPIGKKKVGAVKIIQKGEKKDAKVTKVLQQVRGKSGVFKGYKKIAGTHKDTKSHNVNIRVVSGVKNKKINGLPTYHDSDMAREIKLYSENDGQLYFQQRRPILINLGKKYKKGTFDVMKASKLWRYFIDSALKKYHKEFGTGKDWYKLMDTHDRQLLALEMAHETKDEFDLGNFTN